METGAFPYDQGYWAKVICDENGTWVKWEDVKDRIEGKKLKKWSILNFPSDESVLRLEYEDGSTETYDESLKGS